MILGNVAPAPLSFTWAGAGAASVRAVASASSGAFIIRDASSWLERELRLEQGLGANRVLRHQRRPLEVDVVPVAEQPPVGGELIRHAADIPSLLVGGVSRLRVLDVHAGDDRRLRLGELVDAEGTVDMPGLRAERAILGRRRFTRQSDLLRSIGDHAQETVLLAATRRLAVLRVGRHA